MRSQGSQGCLCCSSGMLSGGTISMCCIRASAVAGLSTGRGSDSSTGSSLLRTSSPSVTASSGVGASCMMPIIIRCCLLCADRRLKADWMHAKAAASAGSGGLGTTVSEHVSCRPRTTCVRSLPQQRRRGRVNGSYIKPMQRGPSVEARHRGDSQHVSCRDMTDSMSSCLMSTVGPSR